MMWKRPGLGREGEGGVEKEEEAMDVSPMRLLIPC